MSQGRKTILLIRNAQPYDFGGGERFPTFVGDALRALNYRPIVVSASTSVNEFATSHKLKSIRGPWWKNQNWSGLRVLLFPIYLVWQFILTIYYAALFARERPLAIHIQSKDDFIAGTMAGKLTGAHVVWTDHADLKHIWLNLGVWYKNPVGKLVYLAARFADAVVVVSKNEARLVTANISKDSFLWRKLELIHNGCSDAYDSTPREREDDNIFTFSIANRLVTDKGIGETITAFQRLHAEFPDTQLLLLGDGPEAQTFREQASKSTGIHFLGHQKNPYLRMGASDVFLQPTYHDAFSVVLTEASMLGLPIIATAIGGNTEIIFDEKTGLLIPSKDADALYEAMKRLLINTALRNKLAAQARQNYLDSFVFDKIIAERYLPLYRGETPSGLSKESIS